MKLPALSLVVSALLAIQAAAQTAGSPATPPPVTGANTRARAATAATKAGVYKGKAILPDPELLDGSKYEAEKRPLYGMISEIEMGEEEGGQQDRVSPNSGPQNPAAAEQAAQPQAGGGAQPKQESPAEQAPGGSAQQAGQGGPQAEAVGAKARSIQGTQGPQADAAQAGSRDMQIGDATLQIQTVPQTPDTVGTEPSRAQQYEKPVPPGQQSNNRNQGVEKGKVIPKGL